MEFWNELAERAPDITKLQNLGGVITKEVENCNKEFKQLEKINNQNIKMLRVFGYF